MKGKVVSVLLIGVLVAGAFALMRLRGHHANLRRELADSQRLNRAAESVRRENARLKRLVAQTQPVGAGTADTTRQEIERARREVAALEARAASRHSEVSGQAVADSTALNANRDPDRGMTRLEHFKDVGRVTPSAALQTLVWAALKGDDTALVDALAMSADARAKAETLLARLPAAARERFPNAESVAAIAVTAEFMKGGALQIAGSIPMDAAHAMVEIRTPGGREAKLPMQLGPSGWQLVVPDRAIAAIERRMGEIGATAPTK